MKNMKINVLILILCLIMTMTFIFSCTDKEETKSLSEETTEISDEENKDNSLINAIENITEIEIEAEAVKYISKISDNIWENANSANMEYCRFKTPEEFIDEADYYIKVISEFVSKENWSDAYRRYDDVCHIQYLMTEGISRVEVKDDNRVYVYLKKIYFEHDFAPIAHEITHVIVPFKGRSLSLSEGLSCYCQDKFGKNPTIFNWGIDVHTLANLFRTNGNSADAAKVFDEVFSVIGTKDAQQSEYANGELRQLLYILSHSFVKYLIDTFGIENFMSLYESNNLIDDYNTFYGKSFEDIKTEWRSVIESSPAMTAEKYINYMTELYNTHNYPLE